MAAPASRAFGKPTKPLPQKERRRNRKKEKQGPSSSCLLLKKQITIVEGYSSRIFLNSPHFGGNHALLQFKSLGSVNYE
jgi:hypothetical protein